MKAICAALFFFLPLAGTAWAQRDSARADAAEMPPGTVEPVNDSASSTGGGWEGSDFLISRIAMDDSIPAATQAARPASRLMPENLSFMERGLWGENGFFRSIGIAGELTPESRKSELSARRTMLTMHQIGGFVTLGLMGVTLYYGQKTLNVSNDTSLVRTYQNKHNQFVTYTIISYALTGLLAVIAPPPLIRRDETSTTTIHKTFAWIHFAGMVLTPIIGNMVRKRVGRVSYIDLPNAHFHQVSAYATTGVFAASMIIITF